MKNVIYIMVEGGVVQEVFSSDRETIVRVIDLDDEDNEQYNEELLKEAKKLATVY